MSETVNGATHQDAGQRTRRRQYRITARLLKEYTVRIYRLAHHLGEYNDGSLPATKRGGVPWSVLAAANRLEAIRSEVSSLALFASQMLVHFQLDEAEQAELRLRIAEAEEAITHAGEVVAAGTGTPGQQPSSRRPRATKW